MENIKKGDILKYKTKYEIKENKKIIIYNIQISSLNKDYLFVICLSETCFRL